MVKIETRWAVALVAAAAIVGAAGAEAQTSQAFRVNTLQVLDPHVYIDAFGTGSCNDITNPPGLLGINVNGLVQDFLDDCEPVGENPEPCVSEFNLVTVFDPLEQTAGAGGALQECMFEGNPCTLRVGLVETCTRDGESVDCDGMFSNDTMTTYSNAGPGNVCLDGLPGTTGPNNGGDYTPSVDPTGGPCGVSGEIDLTLELGSDFVITIPLQSLELAAQYDGDPATGLINGLARGFVPESAADAIKLDLADLSGGLLQATRSLTQLLPGPDKCDGGLMHGEVCTNNTGCPADPNEPTPDCVEGRCTGGANAGLTCASATNCPATLCRISCAPQGFGVPPAGTAQDDRDLGPNGEDGWWFYLRFNGEAVDVPEPPTPTPTPTSEIPPTDTPTPEPTFTPTPTPTLTPTDTPIPPSATPTQTVPACAGDCNGNGTVTIGEVQTSANIFLGKATVASCPAADTNGNAAVSIAEVTQASNSFRLGCP